MFRSVSRFVAALVIVCAFLTLAPAAYARPLALDQPALSFDVSWLQAVMSWLQRLLPDSGERPLASAPAALKSGGSTTDGSWIVVPNTGSCIDPQGNPKPWCSY